MTTQLEKFLERSKHQIQQAAIHFDIIFEELGLPTFVPEWMRYEKNKDQIITTMLEALKAEALEIHHGAELGPGVQCSCRMHCTLKKVNALAEEAMNDGA